MRSKAVENARLAREFAEFVSHSLDRMIGWLRHTEVRARLNRISDP